MTLKKAASVNVIYLAIHIVQRGHHSSFFGIHVFYKKVQTFPILDTKQALIELSLLLGNLSITSIIIMRNIRIISVAMKKLRYDTHRKLDILKRETSKFPLF